MADEITNLDMICSQYGVNDVIFFFYYLKNSIKQGKMIGLVNETKSKKCGKKWIQFCKDSAHLTDIGTNIFAGNIAHFIRHFSLKEFWNEVACSDSHFKNLNRDTDKSSPENCSENKDFNSWSPILNSALSKFYFA